MFVFALYICVNKFITIYYYHLKQYSCFDDHFSFLEYQNFTHLFAKNLSFQWTSSQSSTGALPLAPTGGLPSPDPLTP